MGTPLVSADDYSPAIEPASDEGQLAIENFRIPEGMEARLWAAEPMLANPVAFGIDDRGRIYVCETFRQSKGVEDNRGHMNWLEADLALTDVEQRREMFELFLGADVQDYTKEQDRLRLLEDTDGDGTADKATIFVDGFNDVLDGTGAGILAIEDDVYYTCIPKLYLFHDSNNDGIADEKKVLSEGYGIRVAFRGHDMHGLTLGYDGRIYFSIGDRGFNVLTKEGNRLYHPDTGAVFRCERDGSNLEVFAFGLRNPQELAFDDYGNLFTGDNNSDSGDQARWVHVVEGGDTGWRMYYQYLSDRGPWNRERMWYPYRADGLTTEVQPAYIVPPIVHLGDGPSGLVAYPGVGLPDRYDNHFFLADFRGSSVNSGIWSFALQPKGASFEVIDKHWFLQSILATDVDFGYDGRMYVTDWVDGWNGPGKGRLYTFSDPNLRTAPEVLEAQELMREGFTTLTTQRLGELLDHADRRVRQRAHLQLAERGAVDQLTQVIENEQGTIPRIHAIWALGKLVREGKTDAATLLALLKDGDAEVRAQAIRELGDGHISSARTDLVKRLSAGTPREQSLAAIALGKLGTDADSLGSLVKLLESNADADAVIRHCAAMGLLGVATEDQLAELSGHSSRSVRLGAILAMRRLRSPLLSQFLNDVDAALSLEAARAIHDLNIELALPSLAELPDVALMSDAFVRRVMNANFRLGSAENAQVVASIAANGKIAEPLRMEAMDELLLWDAPPNLDRVTNEYRPIGERSLDGATAAVRASLPGMLIGSDELRGKAVQLAGKYKIPELGDQLVAMFHSDESSPKTRREALTALVAIGVESLDALLAQGLEDENDLIRAQALRLSAERTPDKTLPKLSEVLKSGTQIEQQTAVDVLGKMTSPEADNVLLEQLNRYLAGKVAPEVQLDLLDAAESRKGDDFRDRLAKIEAARDKSDPLSHYRMTLQGGDAERGYAVFFGNAAASCRRCHKVNGNGGEVGPDLSGVAKDKTREYLLESMVLPSAKIAKGFETVVFALADGRIVSGVMRGEDATTYKLVKPTGEVITVVKDDIDDRAIGKSGMPEDIVKQLSKSQIRDLVEYLSTLKTPAPMEGH
ncbi:MAG: HEAT repeat domain-containing protein [Planctomycetaceae bacterium]|nr:HEAT repeat domain-containing protein [Planctomycetaceae bacterium]